LKPFLILMAFVVPAVAGNVPPAEAMKQMEGVYKHRFKNGIITPGKAPMEADEPYESEDIVEIVPHDATHVYVRAELQFYNGHSCSVAGMAGFENGKFVYHDPEPPIASEPACVLTLVQNKDTVTLTDRLAPEGAATCSMHCGARGSLSNYVMPKSTRRPIRYLKRLVASREYKKAVEDLAKYEASLPK
jgi:hypothetical protein